MKNLTNVLYVPEINQNLPNVGQIFEKGYKNIFEDKSCIIKDLTSQKNSKSK